MKLEIEPYTDAHRREWDDFVVGAENGTLFHTRRFLGYHPAGRFEDASILVRDGKKMVAVVPACRRGDGFFSHTGATYGGPAVDPAYFEVQYLAPIVDAIVDHYDGKLGMRLAEPVFFQRPLDPLVYLLGRTSRVSWELGVSKTLDADGDFIQDIRRSRMRTSVRRLLRDGFTCSAALAPEEYLEFYVMLTRNLAHHDTTPTHSASELLDLRERLGVRQMLMVGRDAEGRLCAGAWMLATSPQAWHTFYIAKDYDRAADAAVPCVLIECMRAAAHGGASFLNFGICTEDRGRKMNSGLFAFKEALGAFAVNRLLVEP
jgi:hypothetical protein